MEARALKTRRQGAESRKQRAAEQQVNAYCESFAFIAIGVEANLLSAGRVNGLPRRGDNRISMTRFNQRLQHSSFSYIRQRLICFRECVAR